jgi:hypothetical protein
LVDTYLSDRHLEAPEAGLGCVIAAAGSDVPRQPPEVRRAATQHVKNLVGLIERQIPEWGKAGSRDRAMAILSCIVGALLVARVVDDAALSRSMRKAARVFIKDAG